MEKKEPKYFRTRLFIPGSDQFVAEFSHCKQISTCEGGNYLRIFREDGREVASNLPYLVEEE